MYIINMYISYIKDKKMLKIPKGLSESVNRKHDGQKEKDKHWYKTLLIKLNTVLYSLLLIKLNTVFYSLLLIKLNIVL